MRGEGKLAQVQVALVADDLTGALDAVAPFAEIGLYCVVATEPGSLKDALASGAVIVAVSTNSREMPQADAIEAVRSVAEKLVSVPRVVKKIDSRLKGHVAQETTALATVLGLRKALVCPAIPTMGRIVRNGNVDGFGVDRPIPVVEHMKNNTGLAVTAPDAGSDADIDRIVETTTDDVLLVGARGLSSALARRMAQPEHKPRTLLPLPLPIAIGIGSRDPITLAQVEDVRRVRDDTVYVSAPDGICPDTFADARLLIVQTTKGPGAAKPADVTAAFAEGFVRLAASGRASLVLTGGETASAVLALLGIRLLEVLGEPVSGLPLCRALDFSGSPLILTKSGGFGAPDVLSRLLPPPTSTMRH